MKSVPQVSIPREPTIKCPRCGAEVVLYEARYYGADHDTYACSRCWWAGDADSYDSVMADLEALGREVGP